MRTTMDEWDAAAKNPRRPVNVPARMTRLTRLLLTPRVRLFGSSEELRNIAELPVAFFEQFLDGLGVKLRQVEAEFFVNHGHGAGRIEVSPAVGLGEYIVDAAEVLRAEGGIPERIRGLLFLAGVLPHDRRAALG